MRNSPLTVVHSNDLIEAAYALSIDEMRLILLAATKVDSRNENIGEITITPNEFAQAFSLSKKHVYDNMKKAVGQIMRKPVVFFDGGKRIERSWLVENSYNVDPTDGTHISLEFSPKITPYLFELKERFTIINFEQASKLTTSFSFRLYQWLSKARHLDRTKQGETVAVELEVEWMKSQAGLVGRYSRWGDFKDDVIKPAINQINSKTDISAIFEPIKKGRSVHSVKFNYVVETGAFSEPIRPRLYRRPKVTKGSHDEGVWMRKNLALLINYEKALKEYDNSAKLNIKDVARIAEYSAICDHVVHNRAKKELLARKKKAA